MNGLKKFFTLLLVSSFAGVIFSDTPANCTYEDVRGVWRFSEGSRNFDSTVNCDTFDDPKQAVYVKLYFPNTAVDQHGNRGYWTIIYNQGFEVVLNYRKYFAFSKYTQVGQNVTSYCHETLIGRSHDIHGKNWACFKGEKVVPDKQKDSGIKHHILKNFFSKQEEENENLLRSSHSNNVGNVLYGDRHDLVSSINSVQSSWTAKNYPEFSSKTYHELHSMKGGSASIIYNKPKPTASSEKIKRMSNELPQHFDWRNVSGVNYVSPVRNQASCGSCYAFASMGMLEARLRILTNNTEKIVLSTQNIVDCSPYSQGCSGGFPYLIAGKYAQDFGIVPEECYPYKGVDDTCKKSKCLKTYTAKYEYVGGFYGGCNEDLMKIELVKNGPVSVAFEVYDDFMHYDGGIYKHTGLKNGFNPFELTNHAVLLVGYGKEESTGEKYWIVKNSWGKSWGEDGYFRIARGVDECAIESIAVQASPIPNTA